jgi:copper(I)-binding protein
MNAVARNVFLLALGLSGAMPASAAVAAANACLPKVEKAWIRAAPRAATAYAGYATLRNDCSDSVVIVGVKGRDFVIAQVHETKLENGSMTMRHLKEVPLAPRMLLRFEPNGRHLMLMHPRRELPEGSVVHLELLLDDGRRIPADFKVLREAPK